MKSMAIGTVVMFCLAASLATGSEGRIVIGSKDFPESRLLAELFALVIRERTGLEVETKLSLAGTQVCFEALKGGAIDIYPEYTGTALVSLLGEEASVDRAQALRRVREVFLKSWDLHWLCPLGFENAFEVAIPRRLAEKENVRTLSDLARISKGLKAAFGFEFIERPDGLAGLGKTYGLEFDDVISLKQTLKYEAVEAGEIDCLDVYTTDGRLLRYDLMLLEDDLDFFPPYETCALVRGETLEKHPQIASALGLLSGSLDAARMRVLNTRLENLEEPEYVAQDLAAELGLTETDGDFEERKTRRVGFVAYLRDHTADLGRWTSQHLGLSGAALLLGTTIALPLAMWLERRRRLAEAVIRVIGITQTIPSIAILAFMVPLLGIGALPALVALFIYAIFPIVRSAYSGLRDAPPDVVEAATALGMTPSQVLWKVRMPLAAPAIMAGVRTAGVITVGTATLAAFIGAGGLGEPIVTGLQLADPSKILAGAIPAALLAVLVDGFLGRVEAWVRPKGLEEPSATRGS